MVDNSKSLGIILWFTGLSGAGKTTVAEAVLTYLQKKHICTHIIDGDMVRATYHRNLGFSETDIKFNNAFIVDLCVEERKNYDVVMVPIISPYQQSRNEARKKLSPKFYEIYFSASLDCVRQRDVKGLYSKSKKGLIKNMIGISPANPYQPPKSPDFVINTEMETFHQSVENFLRFIVMHHSKLS